MKRIWKDIKGYEGSYKISNFGEVYSIFKEKILNPKNKNNGYLCITLYRKSQPKRFYIHRLVAINFIPNEDLINKKFINHKNEIKTDNRVENLEWCTIKYNNTYGTRLKRISESNKKYLKRVSFEELLKRYKKQSESYKLFLSSLSAEEKKIKFGHGMSEKNKILSGENIRKYNIEKYIIKNLFKNYLKYMIFNKRKENIKEINEKFNNTVLLLNENAFIIPAFNERNEKCYRFLEK